MGKDFKKLIIFIISFIIINFSWIGLEYVLDGSVMPRYSDNIIVFVLSYLVMNKIYDKLYK